MYLNVWLYGLVSWIGQRISCRNEHSQMGELQNAIGDDPELRKWRSILNLKSVPVRARVWRKPFRTLDIRDSPCELECACWNYFIIVKELAWYKFGIPLNNNFKFQQI